MVDKEIKTVADDLVELVKKRKKIAVEEAAKILKMKPAAVQNLVDFLVEERIFGVEYKFTTPYIYLSEKKPHKQKEIEAGPLKEENIREEFYRKAEQKGLTKKHIGELWGKYLRLNMGIIRQKFYEKAKNRKIPYEEISNLWEKYKSMLGELG